jgi:2-polyprenyl-6-methoxyphenol hydroxylase-like FAD-dependent oxidoreductase
MYNNQLSEYDVIVIGTGFAGNCQVRHLLLKIPNIRVALIDPRLEKDLEEDFKAGESMIEIGTLFLCKELGLYDYVVENHLPKVASNFHWAKDPTKTETTDDYYHIWCNRQPELDSTQINSARFEQDLLHLNKEMGAVFYNGRVVDVDLTPRDALKTVKVQLDDDRIELKAKHISVLAPHHLYNFFSLLNGALDAAASERVYLQDTKHKPANSEVAKMRQEFKNYRYQAQLQPKREIL